MFAAPIRKFLVESLERIQKMEKTPSEKVVEGIKDVLDIPYDWDKPTKPLPPLAPMPQHNVTLGRYEIANRFGHHKATLEGPEATTPRHLLLREMYLQLAEFLDNTLPRCREKDLAMTDLENASMWSHKAIAKTAPLSTD